MDSIINYAENLKNSLKQPFYSTIVYRIMGIGIVHTGFQHGDTKFWWVKKGWCVRNQIMKDDGVLIQYRDGTSEIKYNSDYPNY